METQGVREVWSDGARWPFQAVERKWQARWEKDATFRTPDDPDDARPKYYALVMFPYPSGSGLHVGHPESYVAADILARAKRMQGFRVLHPMGFDSFGLPAEQYAVQTGTHPRITTKANIDTFRRQIKMIGLSYDWEREVRTSDPDYYRWTQWIFLRLFGSWYDEDAGRARPIDELPIPTDVTAAGETAVRSYRDARRLAYQAEIAVNWCPELGTVLANEEVIDGLSERGDHPVVKLPLKQWMLRITKYADRLLDDLDTLDWPEPLKIQQRNWIGKSTGAEMDFPSAAAGAGRGNGSAAEAAGRTGAGVFGDDPREHTIRVYTTRPDTAFGVTFMVLSPEHPLVDHFTTKAQRAAVDAYREAAARKSDLERTDLAKEKSGVDTGGFVINPVNGEQVPVWVADYVLMGYGTGAIMAVPGHDVRDHEFAEQFGLEIRPILEVDGEPLPPGEDSPDARYVRSAGEGVSLDGLDIPTGKQTIVAWLEKAGKGRAASNTKLRDWLFSRQRYWGEPIPVLHGEDGDEMIGVDADELPVLLPEMDDFAPSGRPEPLLAKAEGWVEVTDRSGRKWLRETNTMPQWAGSCWYYLRYIDPGNEGAFCDPRKERAWMPVDVYIGGAEHAVLHLLYARFWHKVLYDLGHVSTIEPFQKLMNQGMILGENNEKMSKSRGNVINPDDVVSELGADALRLYEMFMGPLEVDKPWSTKGIQGISRFLDRAWRAAQFPEPNGDPHDRARHRTIRKVTEDVERVRFNTGIAAMMEYVNVLTKAETASAEDKRVLTLLLAPFAPHLAEEVWERLGHDESLAYEPWPAFDPQLAAAEMITIVVQVNGKVRSKFDVEPDTPKDEIERIALADETVVRHLEGKAPRKVIVVPGRLVNIVV